MSKPHNLLEAVNDLDEKMIEDALSAPVISFKKRRIFRILAAAAVIASLSITAYAVHSLGLWYQNYFAEHSQSAMTQDQMTFLDENVIPVEDSQPGMTLESALTDGVVIFMKLHVTAPEDVVLYPWNEDHVYGFPGNDHMKFEVESEHDVVTLDGVKVYNGLRYLPVEDGDGKDNTMDYMVRGILEGPWDMATRSEIPLDLAGKSLHIRLRDFYQHISSEDFSSAESQKVLSGEWNFEVPITEKGLEEKQLVSEPVYTEFRYLDTDAEEKTWRWKENIPITGITIRALSMDVEYYWPRCGGDPGEHAWAVMKDGSKVKMLTQYGGQGMVQYHAASPIVLDQLDHVEFENGLVVPVPES